MIKHSKNVHELTIDKPLARIAMLSDLHWDNPHCDREMLKRHLDYCLEEDIPVMINGDLFCCMQGRSDRRSSKSDIRPEHNNARYLDSIIETAVEWFLPYANIIKLVGYGNHETAIIKFQETDILQRFVDLLNYKAGSNIQTGGYGGWFVIKQISGWGSSYSTKIKYFHGSGGGGIVTKGAINLTRALETYENFDVFTMGHIHENSCRNDVRDTIDHHSVGGYVLKQKQLHLMLTGTYKEEYVDGSQGWHVERGAPIKPLGGRILTIKLIRASTSDRTVTKYIDSHKFNL
jgi:UDP-2,3-diacylglucosamine pyrophosphatase LpxH